MTSPDPALLPPAKRQKLSPPLISPKVQQLDAITTAAQEPSLLDERSMTLPLDNDLMDQPSSVHIRMDESQAQREADVGITELVNSHLPRFSGILKKRYTDFLVNEILPSGQVLHLDSLKPPPGLKVAQKSRFTETASPVSTQKTEDVQQTGIKLEINGPGLEDATSVAPTEGPAPATNTAVPEKDKSETTSTKFELSPENEQELISLFGASCAQAVLDLHNKILASPDVPSRKFDKVKSPPITDRPLRTKVHHFIRQTFASKLQTATDNDGIIVIEAAPSTATQQIRGSGSTPGKHGSGLSVKPKMGWNDVGGEFLHFSIYKENRDTMEVVSHLARLFKFNPRSFQFAGTKDRRAVTVQRVSAYRMQADRLAGANRNLRGTKVGGFEYKPHGLSLGELAGNEFVITLRECDVECGGHAPLPDAVESTTKVIVEEALRSLREKGFINYFGLQRFGSFSASTDTIGVKMLQENMSGAIDEILRYDDLALADSLQSVAAEGKDRVAGDTIARAKAIRLFRSTGKARPALDMLPHKFSAESALIRHLGHGVDQERAKDYQGALGAIPRQLRSMYGHAYQSLVWNVIAGQRWKLYGPRVVQGDLVMVNEHKDKVVAGATTNLGERGEPVEEVDAHGEPIILPSVDDYAANADNRFERARPLSQEEAESGDYNVFDVVLPTPGYDILYPPNAIGEVYKTFMASERGGGLDPNNMRRRWKDISLSGNYRKLLARPLGDDPIEFEVRSYTDDNEQMVKTDLQKLQEPAVAWKAGFEEQERQFRSEDKARAGLAQDTAPDDTREIVEIVEKERKLAVVLKFKLGTSQYATMALRELMGPGGVRTYKPDFGGGRG